MEEQEGADSPADEKMMSFFEAYQKAREAGNSEEMAVVAHNIFAALAEMPPNEDPAFLWLVHGHSLTIEGRWEDALAAYQQSLDLAKDDTAKQFLPLRYMADAHRILGHPAESLASARAATAAARRIKTPLVLVMALHLEAIAAENADEWDAARACAEEAMSLLPNAPQYAVQRGNALVLRARLSIQQGSADAAKADLEEACRLLPPSALAPWWAATARLREKQSDWAGAFEARREAVTLRRQMAARPYVGGAYPKISLAIALRALGEAAQGCGDTHAANAAFEESRAIYAAFHLPVES